VLWPEDRKRKALVVPEAGLDFTEHGLVPNGGGWFVLNAREARWRHGQGRPAICKFEGEPDFSQLEINLSVLGPGEAMAMYHWGPIRRTSSCSPARRC